MGGLPAWPCGKARELAFAACRAETELAKIENRQADAERHANKRGFGMSNVNEKNKRINFLNAYQNVSSAPENQKVCLTPQPYYASA